MYNPDYAELGVNVRKLTEEMESVLVNNVYEGETFIKKYEDISIQIKVFTGNTTYSEEEATFEDPNTKSVVEFPISSIARAGDRQSLAVTTFTMNPFFGSRYEEKTKKS